MTTRRKRMLIWGGIVGATLTTSVWLYHFFGLDDPFNDSSFDQVVWAQNSNSDYDNPRGHMVESVIDLLEESRPSRIEVISMLGPPEEDCSRLEPPVGSLETCLSYMLGFWSGFRMDLDTLDVYFGADGRFHSALPVQH